MTTHLTKFILLVGVAVACAQSGKPDKKIIPDCEDCELMFEGMPESILWSTRLAEAKEPGEPMVITGTIFKNDGKTPAPGVILYVYHTNAKGIYSPASSQKEARRHGHLRGWMKSDDLGQYQFTTIRPASYPNRNAPQHIHPIIQESESSIYWIDEYLFDDDPLLTSAEKTKQQKRGGSGIIHLTKNNQGIWIGQRNITLGMNIPSYKPN